MAGLVAAFIFAVQMLNFQVLPGVSGHLLGGVLAAMLVGPWVGALCVSTVLVVQCLLFADGGLTALGLNITNMALIGTAAGYVLIAVLLRVLPKTPTGLAVTAFVASVVSVTTASHGLRAGVRAGRHHPDLDRHSRRRDGRSAPAHRHRRGPDRGDHGGHRGQGASRSCVRLAALPQARGGFHGCRPR